MWSKRDHHPVPDRHRTVPHVLNFVAFTGLPFVVWGVIALDVWPAIFGLALIIGAKLWYIDRIAQLCDDVTRERPDLRFDRTALRTGERLEWLP